MKQTTALYKQLREQTGSYYEVKIVRGPVTYGMDKLKSIRISQALFQDSGPQVGGVNSSKCIVELRESSTNWPRMASFYVMVRIVSDSGQADSAWLSFGTFFTDERKADQYGNLRIVAFDAMLMMEQSWTDKITNVPSNWPITSKKAAQLIEEATLIQFEDINSLDNTLAYIGFDTGSTARDVLKSIAVGNGGSWYVTANGKFRLVRLINREFEGVPAIAGVAVAGISVVGDTSSQSSDSDYDMIQLGLSVKSLESNTPTDAITGVEVEGNNGLVAFAGNRDGYVLKTQCGYANTAIASLCLNRVSGYVYRPFEAKTARLDPVAEIGDYVVIANTAYPIVTLDWNVSKKIVADISAHWEEEVDHEYTKLSEAAKQYKRIIEAAHEEARTAIEQSENSIKLYATQTFVGKSAYEADLQRLYDQIDGAIETWQGNTAPTLNNLPASEWDTDAKKAEHIGDLYLVNTDSDAPEAGNYYRFERSGNTYSWHLLGDTALTQALTQAMAAAEAADRAMLLAEGLENTVAQKAKVFVTDTNHANPTPPYYEGDLWFTGDAILTCIHTRESGAYSASDWAKKNTYVDADALDTAVTTKVTSAFEVAADSITATVEQNVINNLADDFLTTEGGDTTSFGWELTQTGHTWYANGDPVMSVTSNGLAVEGEIHATSGYIGTANDGFIITSSSIRKGMESLDDTTHDGVYIGTNGIALGKGNFKVTNSGAATMTNLQVLGGSISIGEYVDDQGNTQPTFYVSSDGTLHAENGVFNGTIYAANIADTVSEGQLAEVIQNALAAAKNYAAVTANTLAPSTTIPPYFRAGIIVASEYFYSDGYYVDTGNESTEFDLANHYHNITANNSTGVVTIGAPVKNNGTPPSFNIAATSFYQNNVAAARTSGANDAKANHITWAPITPASYSNIIATHGDVRTYANSNNKYIQVQFELTADHTNNNNESTYAYTIPNEYITAPATFNVDVTDLVNSGGTISVSRLDIKSATNYNASSSTSTDITGIDSNSGKPNYTITAKGTVQVNSGSSYSNVDLDITGIMEDLYLKRYSVSVRDYNSTTHRLYLSSNYEVRLDNGNDAYELILDVYDKGDDNSVDISNYISGGSGIDINDVRLYLTQASNVSDDYYTGISMTAGNLTYDSDNDRLIGYANAFLDTGTNTEQDSRRVKIIMSASKKPGSGGTTINTTGVNRVLSGSTYKEAYQSGNSWYIDVKPTVNGTEYTTVPLNVSDVYTKGYNANPGTVGAWSSEIEGKDYLIEDPLSISFGSEVNYYNGYLYGNVKIKHGTYQKYFTVSMSTEDVPTGGDTPSGGSYARTGQSFYVDEQSYDYGYSYDGTSSKVAITGYVNVDGHRVNVNSFDIGVGSIWYDGYQAGSGGSEGVTIIDANGNSRTYNGGTVYISEIVKSSTQYGTTYAYQWGADGETPYVVSRYA